MAVASGRQHVASETQYRRWLGAREKPGQACWGCRPEMELILVAKEAARGERECVCVCVRAHARMHACMHSDPGLVGKKLPDKSAWGK